MRDIDEALYETLAAANSEGLVPRRFLRMTGKDFTTGVVNEALFWTGDGVLTLLVESPDDDTAVTRTYYGGVNLSTSPIALVSNLTIQTLTVTLNNNSDRVKNFVRGYDLRLGKVEVHDAMFDPRTRNLVSIAPLVFLGEIDGAPIETGEKNGEGSVTIRAASDVISMLSRTNPAKSSYQEQYLREQDEFNLYTNTVGTWKVPWGQEASS